MLEAVSSLCPVHQVSSRPDHWPSVGRMRDILPLLSSSWMEIRMDHQYCWWAWTRQLLAASFWLILASLPSLTKRQGRECPEGQDFLTQVWSTKKETFWLIIYLACSYEYTEASCAGVPHCEISSPGYPGIFPQNMLCRYHVKTQGGGDKGVRIKINNLSIPKDEK